MEENNLVPLITNLATKNRHYVVFAGAGLSIDAGVKSGWDILIETLKPLYLEEKKKKELPKDYFSVIDKWYTNHKKYSKMGYSEILELIYEGDVERKEYLKQFFIDAKPGESHRQLAKMVNNQLVRFIFTTNFDDLIEKALEDIGITDYDIVHTNDDLKQSKSWDKVNTCRIYKLHGDYKTGQIRNTLEELKTLDDLIADDFQYIIERHGIIQIGYAGRDKGVMEHYLRRKPFSYPFYWQYKKYPEETDEFKLFHELVDKYKNIHKREIHFVQDDSASNFIQNINDGIDRHERYVIVTSDSPEDYEEYIINNEEKKIRAMTISQINKFQSVYDEYLQKEKQDNHYAYKFDIYMEYISQLSFMFSYFEILLKYDLEDEARWFIKKALRTMTNIDIQYSKEFIQKSSPYHLVMIWGSISLKYEKINIIEDFFNLEFRTDSSELLTIMKPISYGREGWDHIGQEKYSSKYILPKYSITELNLLPENVSRKEFNEFDSYVTLYILFNKLGYFWVTGSAMSYSSPYLVDIFNKYFKHLIKNKEDADKIAEELLSVRGKLGFEAGEGFDNLVERIQYEFRDK